MRNMDINWLKVSAWEKYHGLLHGFCGRKGGKSVGPYATLNSSYRVGDDPKVVSQNVCDMKLAVGIHDGKVITMKQVHGDHIAEVQETNIKEAGEADGMVTAKTNGFLAVLTADCVPILFVAPKKRVVAVVHAGWRGTLTGIAEKLVRQLKEQHGVPADEIEAALGPAIGGCCYEIGSDVAEPMVKHWGDLAEASLERRSSKTYLDLRKLNRSILENAGVMSSQIHQLGPCTCCAKEDYFSYRRERSETGRQMSFIGWEAE